jgi:hypothetical protein
MKTPTRTLQAGVALVSAAVLLAGCSLFHESPKEQAEQVEPLLSAAGFRMKLADTPEKMDHLKTLPALKLVPHQKDGKTFYGYADPYACKCLYVGDQAAYQAYQKLAVQKQIATEQRQAAMMNEDAASDWAMGGFWGPFGPFY